MDGVYGSHCLHFLLNRYANNPIAPPIINVVYEEKTRVAKKEDYNKLKRGVHVLSRFQYRESY